VPGRWNDGAGGMVRGQGTDSQDRAAGGGPDGAGPAARRNRQARVGILPNTNRLPLPPPHRPPLTGKWPPLRSSRRPRAGDPDVSAADTEPAPQGAVAPAGPGPDAVLQGRGGLRIDIDGLNRSVDGLGTAAPARAGFAAAFLGQPDPGDPRVAAGEGATGAVAGEVETQVAPAADPASDTGRGWRGAWARWFGRN